MIDTTNIVAVDYKGKHFILHDKDRVDEMDLIDNFVDVSKAVNEHLEEYLDNCSYYGVPEYIGSNEELWKKIKETYNEQK